MERTFIKKIAIVGTIAIFIVINIYFFIIHSNDNESIPLAREFHSNHNNVIISPVCEDEMNSWGDIDGGQSLFVWHGDIGRMTTEDPMFYGIIYLEKPQDLLYAQISNLSSYRRYFVFKIFYNYEEVAFRITGDEDYGKEFLFVLDEAQEMKIPFHLSSELEPNEYNSKLTVGVFESPHRFAKASDIIRNDLGIILNFEIRYGFDHEVNLSVSEEKPCERLYGLQFHGLMINRDFSPAIYQAYFPPNPLRVQRGERIELAFLANAYTLIIEPLENYLIISMLDWHQTLMDGQPYLLIDATEKTEYIGDHGRFFIDAPMEIGYFDFVAFIVPNPMHSNSGSNFFPLEMSFRFTIEVTE